MKQTIAIALLLICKITFGQTTLVDSFWHGGLMREYRLYIPALYNAANSVPLVFNLHGYTSNHQQQESYGDFRPIADTANFLVVHPNGTLDGSGFRFWNAFGASPVDDIGFLLALLDTLKANYNIDENRVYSTGMSNGGFMSHLLACTAGNQFAAIASVTGSMTIAMKTGCTPFHPTPVMQIHGTADAVVPYLGGGVYVPVDTVVKFWYNQSNCNPVPAYSAVPDIAIADGCTAEQFVYGGGVNGSSVEFFKVNNGGHSWPGAPINVNITNMDFIASKEIWRFFSQYSLVNLATQIEDYQHSEGITIYPNPSVSSITLNFEQSGLKQIQVLSVTGQQVFTESTFEKNYNIHLNLKGIYFVGIRIQDKTYFRKIIMQ